MKQLGLTFLSLLLFCCCVEEPQQTDSPKGNFLALWKIMDEHYCFFEEKKVDWNAVKQQYEPQITEQLNNQQLFEILTNMLAEVKDGHVNLSTGFDFGRYWQWYENYPSNVSDSLIRHYLSTDYKIASGLEYRILDDHVGYVRCSSFANDIGTGNLDEILYYLAPCRGIIIDVRNNGGGMMMSAEKLASRFTNVNLLVGYMQHKTGKGHRDFSAMQAQILKPGKGVRWQKKAVVLTNRGVYSAANEFVKCMKQCPNVTVVGDKTGGGAGMPFSSELPNGWGVRFSACPMYDKDKNSTEFGIEPHYYIMLNEQDRLRNIDTLIEFARRIF